MTAMKIWAHRGCSYDYPENTLESFRAALDYEITGIELDIQLTKDGKMIVLHDEKVDRTTDGKGYLKDFTLDEVKQLKIMKKDGTYTRIPTLEEVLDLLEEPMKKRGLMLNIELKNSEVDYPGMERLVLDEIARRGLEPWVIYSSFSFESLKILKKLKPDVHIAVLHSRWKECIARAIELDTNEIHPYMHSFRRKTDLYGKGWIIRVYNVERHEPLYGDKNAVQYYDPYELEKMGITDMFTNVPNRYVNSRYK